MRVHSITSSSRLTDGGFSCRRGRCRSSASALRGGTREHRRRRHHHRCTRPHHLPEPHRRIAVRMDDERCGRPAAETRLFDHSRRRCRDADRKPHRISAPPPQEIASDESCGRIEGAFRPGGHRIQCSAAARQPRALHRRGHRVPGHQQPARRGARAANQRRVAGGECRGVVRGKGARSSHAQSRSAMPSSAATFAGTSPI